DKQHTQSDQSLEKSQPRSGSAPRREKQHQHRAENPTAFVDNPRECRERPVIQLRKKLELQADHAKARQRFTLSSSTFNWASLSRPSSVGSFCFLSRTIRSVFAK